MFDSISAIQEALFSQQDTSYRDFQAKLIPTLPPGTMIGVRTPALRKMGKSLSVQDQAGRFLLALPHRYFEENQLHAFIVSDIRDYERCLDEIKRFLPYVDNWATCDQMSPKVFKKHRVELRSAIDEWLSSGATYTVRFAIGMLMEHYLDEAFDPACLELVAAVRSEEYYVRMMAAWFFATALAKQYEAALPYLEQRRLDPWTHNKTIQKAVESYRISDDRKALLRKLRISKAG